MQDMSQGQQANWCTRRGLRHKNALLLRWFARAAYTMWRWQLRSVNTPVEFHEKCQANANCRTVCRITQMMTSEILSANSALVKMHWITVFFRQTNKAGQEIIKVILKVNPPLLSYFQTWYPVLPRMLLARCASRPRDVLETTWAKMAGNVVKSHLYVLIFETGSFIAEKICTLARAVFLFGWAFVLFSARLAVHYFAIYLVSAWLLHF